MTTGIDRLGLDRVCPGTISVTGALAAESVEEFETAVFGPNAEPVQRVELSGCTFLDSSGVTALLRLNSALQVHGEQLILANPSRPCRRVLEICGLLDVFCVVEEPTDR